MDRPSGKLRKRLGYSQIQAGSAYIPVTFGVAISSGISSQLFARIGTRPIIIAGALLGAGGLYWLSRIPVHGSYLTDLLPGLMIMSFGLGAVFVGVTTAANAGVPADKAGLAAALVNASMWIGGALGIAVFSPLSTSRADISWPPTHRNTKPSSRASTERYSRVVLLAAALIAARATNTRGEPVPSPSLEPVAIPETG